MFNFLYGGKAKAVMRTKIIAVYLDNFIRYGESDELDDWGNNWKEKSLNDVVKFFMDKETNEKFKTKLKLNTFASVPNDGDDVNIALIYTIIHRTYFDKDPSPKDIDTLHNEYRNEVNIRGL